MNRTLTLRRIQLTEVLRYAFYFFLILIAIGGAFLAMELFGNGNFELDYESLTFELLAAIFLTFNFFKLVFAVSDGSSHFDSALRFGISRKSYFLVNLITFILLALLGMLVSKGQSMVWDNNWTQGISTLLSQITLQDYFLAFIEIMAYVIGSHLFYRFGWKVFIPIIAFPIVSGLVIGFLGQMQFLTNFQQLMKFADYVLDHLTEIYTGISLILIGLYYLFITRTEVKS